MKKKWLWVVCVILVLAVLATLTVNVVAFLKFDRKGEFRKKDK
jgi:hypothetical protein